MEKIEDIKYSEDNFFFIYRVSALIFNKDKTKILLFYGDDMDYYMLPGGKVHQLEKSKDAIKREIFEELGFSVKSFPLTISAKLFIKLSLSSSESLSQSTSLAIWEIA